MTQTATFNSGGVPTPPFAFLPDPGQLFVSRAARFRALATGNLAPYLTFLADLTDVQAELARELGPASAPDTDLLARAKATRMPPIDRAALVRPVVPVLQRFCALAAALEMPPPARLALEALTAATPDEQAEVLSNILSDRIPEDSVAPHLFAAAAVQVEAVRRAAALDAGSLVKIMTGACPSCGGKPVTSTVTASLETLEGTRYATCATCATRWNEVRVTCLCCGGTKGISYRSVGDPDRAADKAPVRAELCSQCHGWTKVLYQTHDPRVEAVADDVSSLGLDALMKDTDSQRGGFHPFLAGW